MIFVSIWGEDAIYICTFISPVDKASILAGENSG